MRRQTHLTSQVGKKERSPTEIAAITRGCISRAISESGEKRSGQRETKSLKSLKF